MTEVLNQLHWRVRASELKRDPEMKAWVREQKAKVASGEIWAELERQEDPRVIVERYRSRPA